MIIKKNKQGQAAIEFLMTYGWMLLVVLIVGALIFSFVDFGSLLPNKFDIKSPNIQPIVGDSFVTADGDVLLAFKYNGVNPITFKLSSITNTTGVFNLTYNFGDDSCTNVVLIHNADSGAADINNSGTEKKIRFRNGHSGYIKFKNCLHFDQVDVVEGSIKLTFESTQTGSETPVYGSVRFAKQ